MTLPVLEPVHGYGWNTADRWGGWDWESGRRGEHFRRCSFCGSINPDDLVAEAGWAANWADWKYGWPHKFYVDIPNRDPESLSVYSHTSGSKEPPDWFGDNNWVKFRDMNEAQAKALRTDGYLLDDGTFQWCEEDDWFWIKHRSNHYGKFYTTHLADPRVSETVKQVIYTRSGLKITFSYDDKGRLAHWGRP